uniref:CS domain-containing protein n=1 Tax=Sinocyclocheilus grahami TaxID=75366 RepID=A0A672M4W7_SINGR
MPLIVRDHTWTQNQSTVYISLPLKGVKTANVHVICTDEYLKVRENVKL